MIRLRPYRGLLDAAPVATNMRQVEVVECRSRGETPMQALTRGAASSVVCMTATVHDEPVAIYGLVMPEGVLSGRGSPWLLGTDEVTRHPFAMVRMARPVVQGFRLMAPRMENHVHRDNTPSIRWLRRLGFTVSPDVVDIGGQPHHRFTMGQDHHV